MGLIVPVIAAIWFAMLTTLCIHAAVGWWQMHHAFATVFSIRDPAVATWRPLVALVLVIAVSNLLIVGCWWSARAG